MDAMSTSAVQRIAGESLSFFCIISVIFYIRFFLTLCRTHANRKQLWMTKIADFHIIPCKDNKNYSIIDHS